MSSSQFQVSDTNGQKPTSHLDVVEAIMDPESNDEVLNEMNLGLGNLSKREYYQQVVSFRNGMFADAAFSRRLVERAIEEAKHRLAVDGYRYTDEDGRTHEATGWNDLDETEREKIRTSNETDRRRWIEEKQEKLWSELPDEQQLEVVAEYAGITTEWTPPHWRMMEMRTEASRSINARAIDNYFGRVNETVVSEDDEKAEGLRQRVRGER